MRGKGCELFSFTGTFLNYDIIERKLKLLVTCSTVGKREKWKENTKVETTVDGFWGCLFFVVLHVSRTLWRPYWGHLHAFVQQWNVINLVWGGVFQFFILALYHEKVPDLNSCLALLTLLANPTLSLSLSFPLNVLERLFLGFLSFCLWWMTHQSCVSVWFQFGENNNFVVVFNNKTLMFAKHQILLKLSLL